VIGNGNRFPDGITVVGDGTGTASSYFVAVFVCFVPVIGHFLGMIAGDDVVGNVPSRFFEGFFTAPFDKFIDGNLFFQPVICPVFIRNLLFRIGYHGYIKDVFPVRGSPSKGEGFVFSQGKGDPFFSDNLGIFLPLD